MLGDQVSGDDEKDVDPDEAAWEPGDAEMEGDDAQHRERAQEWGQAVKYAVNYRG
jgi:hypothetical protein